MGILQLDYRSARRTREINLQTNQKSYDNSETTVGKLLAGRIQICPNKNRPGRFGFASSIVEYSSVEVSNPSEYEVPQINGKLIV